MRTIVITPTYNERQNIAELAEKIRSQCSKKDLDILAVDSASPDGTAEVVRTMMTSDPRVFLLEQPKKLGLGNAYLDGMRWVLERSYDAVITMDADLSHHPKYLDCMLGEIERHDLVIGSRYVRGGGVENFPVTRQCLSRFANWYASTLTGLPFHDLTSGFQCFRTALLKKILRHNIHTEGYAFLVELKFLSMIQQARYQEIPIIFTDRTRGSSKISKRVIFESMMFVMKLATQRGRIKKILASRQIHG